MTGAATARNTRAARSSDAAPSSAVTTTRASANASCSARATSTSPESAPLPTTISPRIEVHITRYSRAMTATVDELLVADPPELWEELGFRVQDDACDIGSVRIRLDSRAGKRIASWSLCGTETAELDGLATMISAPEARDYADPHPNGVVSID